MHPSESQKDTKGWFWFNQFPEAKVVAQKYVQHKSFVYLCSITILRRWLDPQGNDIFCFSVSPSVLLGMFDFSASAPSERAAASVMQVSTNLWIRIVLKAQHTRPWHRELTLKIFSGFVERCSGTAVSIWNTESSSQQKYRSIRRSFSLSIPAILGFWSRDTQNAASRGHVMVRPCEADASGHNQAGVLALPPSTGL